MKKSITSNQYAVVIQWLKQARIDQGLTMRVLASQINKPHTFVQKIESLERRLDFYEYVVYCRALKLDPHYGIDLMLSPPLLVRIK